VSGQHIVRGGAVPVQCVGLNGRSLNHEGKSHCEGEQKNEEYLPHVGSQKSAERAAHMRRHYLSFGADKMDQPFVTDDGCAGLLN
jgi:hypothetical protein